MIRALRADEVTFTIIPEDEDIPIEGSFDSGDKEADAELVQQIRDDFNGGNAWAWCCVKVTAYWKGWHGVDYLGACSYKSEKDFCEPGGYFEDMKAAALADLNETIAREWAKWQQVMGCLSEGEDAG